MTSAGKEKKLRAMIILVTVFAVPALSGAATIHVPADYPSIQLGIILAANGDTVLVAPGTYVENIDFKGKGITVKSSGGAMVTVIDGNQAGSVVTFQFGEGLDSVLDGFTVTNGDVGGSGGGILCDETSPTIMNNIIKGNTAGWAGGGIHCHTKSTSWPIIMNNTITGNTATAWGGGIYSDSKFAFITNNIITENTADSSGGGIGGLSSTITNNIIAGNTASDSGGGINCLWSSNTIITNNTITGNMAEKGGGINCFGFEGDRIITNTIIWDNIASYGPEIYHDENSGILTISYSDVKGGKSSIHVGPGSTFNWGTGMIDTDPLFTQGSSGFFYLSQLAAGQIADSPCVDAGGDLASNLGMDIYWTRTDEIPDSGTVDMGFHYGTFSFPALMTDTFRISEAAGGGASFLLLAGVGNANRNYILLGGITGTVPGTPLPGGMATLPLNWDVFTDLVLNVINTPVCSNFMGQLDGTGSANANFNTFGPIPGAAGITVNFAYAMNMPWNFVSNPVSISVVP